MNSSKIKSTLFLLLFLCSFISNAQIPDSLQIDLPWSIISLPTCESTMGEGPKTANETVYIALAKDSIHQSSSTGDCEFRVRIWSIIDWGGGLDYEFIQIGKVSSSESTLCINEVYLHYDDFPITLTPADLLLNMDPTHTYSFSYADPDAQSITINNNSEISLEVFVYDHTNNTIGKSNIFITHCTDEIELIFPPTAEVVFDGEPYIELTLEMLGVSIDYPCESYTTKIRVGNQSNSIITAQSVGKTVSVLVEMELNSGVKIKKFIDVFVSGIKPDPHSMYIEDKDFTAGETIALEIWSEGIMGLTAWQLQIEFENAEVLAIQPSSIFSEIPSFIMNDGSIIRALWTPPNALSLDAPYDATWFTIVLKPEIDGNTIDIFKEVQNDWSLIAIDDENYIYEFEVEFTFNVAPRNTLSSSNDLKNERMTVYPNPATDGISISGLSGINATTEIEIFDLEGKLCIQRKIKNLDNNKLIDISDLPRGMFVMKVSNGAEIYSQKITKI